MLGRGEYVVEGVERKGDSSSDVEPPSEKRHEMVDIAIGTPQLE